jgi:glycosyltransferase involved in cell wall biosynthesis
LRKFVGDPSIRVIPADHSGSSAISRNRGIEASSGDYLAFLDSDDLWLPRKLELQVNALTASTAGWCYCDYSLIDEFGREIPLRAGQFRPLSGRIVEPLLLAQTAVHADCLLVRRKLLKSVGMFDPTLKKREDLDFDLRLAAATDAVALPEVLARVRDHPARKTAKADFGSEHTA